MRECILGYLGVKDDQKSQMNESYCVACEIMHERSGTTPDCDNCHVEVLGE